MRPFFGGRITIALRDTQNRIVGFAARALQSSDRIPKYLNSPTSPLYNKSAFLYGLHQALPLLRQGNPAVIAEGYFDVIALRELGYAAVCAGGTSFSAAHALRLARYTKEAVLCLDGDTAGRAACQKVLLLLLQSKFCVRSVALPEGDPADWWATGKGEQLDALLREAPDALEVLIRQAAGQQTATPSQRLQRLDALLPFLAAPARELLARQYVRLAAKLLGEDEATLQQEVVSFRRAAPPFATNSSAGTNPARGGPQNVTPCPPPCGGLLPEASVGSKRFDGQQVWKAEPPSGPCGGLLLRLVLAHPQLAAQCQDAVLEQVHPVLRQFVRHIAAHLAQEHSADPHEVLKRVPVTADSPLLPLLLRVRRDKSVLTLDEARSILQQWHARVVIQHRQQQNQQRRQAQAVAGAPTDVRALWEDTVALHELFVAERPR